MRAVVFAYHNMGVIGIKRLMDAGFEIPLVLSHEDDPGEKVWFRSVPDLCKNLSIPCGTPADPNQHEWIDRIKAAGPDIVFSFYYRLMLKDPILSIPQFGAYNLHGSYLPRYRGRCPVNWAIIKGEKETGVTLHEMVEQPDAGAIVIQRKVEISPEDTALTLFFKIEQAASHLLGEILPRMRRGEIPRTPQDLSKGSYFGGRSSEDGRIDWCRPAEEIYNLIRAVTRPYPGAFGFIGGERILLWWAVRVAGMRLGAGSIALEGDAVAIGTGDGVLAPQEIEVGGRVLKGAGLHEYFKGHEREMLR